MPKQAHKTAQIEARITPDALRLVKRAAKIQGRSLSEFIVAAAQEAAHKTIKESHLIRLSLEDQNRFAELLLAPPEPTAALKAVTAASAKERIDALLLEGLDSGEPIPVTAEYWEAKKRRLTERLGKVIRPQ